MHNRMDGPSAIALPPGNDVDMQVSYRLPARLTMIPPDIKAVGLQRGLNEVRYALDRYEERRKRVRGQGRHRRRVSFRNQHRVSCRQRMNVEERYRLAILVHHFRLDFVRANFAKKTVHMIEVLGSTYHVLGGKIPNP